MQEEVDLSNDVNRVYGCVMELAGELYGGLWVASRIIYVGVTDELPSDVAATIQGSARDAEVRFVRQKHSLEQLRRLSDQFDQDVPEWRKQGHAIAATAVSQSQNHFEVMLVGGVQAAAAAYEARYGWGDMLRLTDVPGYSTEQ